MHTVSSSIGIAVLSYCLLTGDSFLVAGQPRQGAPSLSCCAGISYRNRHHRFCAALSGSSDIPVSSTAMVMCFLLADRRRLCGRAEAPGQGQLTSCTSSRLCCSASAVLVPSCDWQCRVSLYFTMSSHQLDENQLDFCCRVTAHGTSTGCCATARSTQPTRILLIWRPHLITRRLCR